MNVVNLLASQWGELMTNVGDFDGHTTWGSRQAGGDGEYLDTVGTRAEDTAYKRMRLVMIAAAHRSLHNRLHQMGTYHGHTPVTDHPEHH